MQIFCIVNVERRQKRKDIGLDETVLTYLGASDFRVRSDSGTVSYCRVVEVAEVPNGHVLPDAAVLYSIAVAFFHSITAMFFH